MQLFGTSFNVDVGNIRLRIAVGLDDRTPEPGAVRIEDMPRFELGAK